MDSYPIAWEQQKILLAIPVYNEAPFLSGLLEATIKYAPKTNILLINDGSIDNTKQIIDYHAVSCIEHSENSGKGDSLISAIRYAQQRQYNWLITMDGDGQHDPQHLLQFIQAIEIDNCDIIIGHRQRRDKNMPWSRQLSNGITSILISLLNGGTRIHDTQCGFRALKLNCIDPTQYRKGGFQLESEMLLVLGKKGYKIIEIPISTIYGDEHSNIDIYKDTFKFIVLLLRYLW